MSHTIPLQAVRNAVMLATVRSERPEAFVARFAAYSSYPSPFSPRCADPRPLRLLPMHFGPMESGDMERLLRRHRTEAGLAGVRRTWGAGMRELQTEFSQGVMR